MKIIYETEAGIAVVHPTGELSIEEVFIKDVPDQYKASALIVQDDIIPSDRTFRWAWECTGGNIIENINKAKLIHKDRLRQERRTLLEELDVEFIKALEDNKDTKSIVDRKNILRDITMLVDLCETIEEIKAVQINANT